MKKIIGFISVLIFGLFSTCISFAQDITQVSGGSWMLPQAKELLNNGEDRQAYDVAYKIVQNNPNNWESYKIMAIASANLGNYQEALNNINKAIDICNKEKNYVEIEIFYSIRSSLLFYITVINQSKISNDNFYKIIADMKTIFDSRLKVGILKSDIFFCYFIPRILAAPCSDYYKIKILIPALTNEIFRKEGYYFGIANFFTIYATTISLANRLDNSQISQFNTTKEQILVKLKELGKFNDNEYYTDIAELVYYNYIGDSNTSNIIYKGIRKNISNRYYKQSSDFDMFERDLKKYVYILNTSNYKKWNDSKEFYTILQPGNYNYER